LPSLQTVSGSGDFKDASLISFSYAEDATPISPANLNGGTGQVSAQLVQNEATRGSRIAINNEALLSDEEYGNINFTIKKLSLNEGLVSVNGSTIQAKLDVERVAQPQGSDAGGYNLYEAIVYYCSLVDVVPSFEAGLQAQLELIDIDFIGWKGNVWEHLKMLCSAYPIDEDGSLLEMYILEDQLWFRQALSTTLQTADLISSQSIEIDAYDASQTVKLVKYSTDYRADSLIRQQNIDSFNYANLELVSITDSFQVQANEKITRRVLINASLESVESPIPVQSIVFPVTYSQYVIVGKDEVPLTAAQWEGQGGLVEVSLTENPNEIEITITGANYPELEPFKIGVESSGGEDYPAFYLRGTGVFFEKTEHTLYTGAPDSEIGEAALIDNPFITSDEIFWGAAARINRELCGPTFSLNQSIPTGIEFGTTTGSIVEAFDSKFRIDKTNFGQTGVTIQGSSYVTFADFDAVWSGDDISDFNTSMDGLTFNEFSIAALTKG
jgi:hypothetical protein